MSLSAFTEDMIKDLRKIIGDQVELEIVKYEPEPDMGLFGELAGILQDADPGAIPMPLLLPAVSGCAHLLASWHSNLWFYTDETSARLQLLENGSCR